MWKYSKNDHYWIMNQLWHGFTPTEIAEAIGTNYKSISSLRKKLGFKGLPNGGRGYGISEIARELGISRQRIHQLVKSCRNPYRREIRLINE